MTTVEISKGLALEVDFEALAQHPAVVDAALRFAVKQALTNTHAGIKIGEEDYLAKSLALAEKRLEAMMAGTWAQVERGSRVDAVMREMREMAETELKGKLKAIGKKVSDFKPDVWKEVIGKHVAANEATLRPAAEAKLAIKPEASEVDATEALAMLGIN